MKRNVWVCFKVVPDFNHVLEEDWQDFGPDTDVGYAKHSVNCFDESALEIALRLKDEQNVHLGAMTLALKLHRSVERQLFAAGFDEVVRIDTQVEFAPEVTGRLLANELRKRKPDLVLMGQQAGYADTGLVPYYVADALDCELRIVGNDTIVSLRMSTLKQQLAAKKMQAEVVPCEAPKITRPMLVRNKPVRKVEMIAAEELPGRLNSLLEGKQEHTKQIGFNPPGNVVLEEPTYAIEHSLPCVTGVIGMGEDGRHVITRACGAQMEWHIPIGAEKQVWVLQPAGERTKLLLVGGRGMGAAGIETLRRIAQKRGGQVGLTRAAAQNGWGNIDEIIGQSGRIAAPKLCVVFGVSGAAAFMAGVEKAGTLVAVNTDPDAPIFRYADIGVIADAEKMAEILL